MKKRAVVLEFNRYHGEVLPSLVSLLNGLGFSADVYVHPDLLARNPFAGLTHLDFKVMPIERDSLDMALWKDRLSVYDVLVLNTFQPDETIREFAEIGMPMLLVVHNGRVLLESEFCREHIIPRHREVLVLSPHVASFLKKNGVDSTWIFPGLFAARGELPLERGDPPTGDLDGLEEVGPARRTFCVQGRIEPKRRNYESIVTAARKLRKRGFRNFSVKILGKHTSKGGARLRRTVLLRGLHRYFSFSRSVSGYDDFYRELRASTFLCPLIDRENGSYRAYFEDKASSSIPSAVGNHVIPVIHEELASIYGMDRCAITYRDGMLAEALETALELTPSEMTARRSELSSLRNAFMVQSERNLEGALNRIMA